MTPVILGLGVSTPASVFPRVASYAVSEIPWQNPPFPAAMPAGVTPGDLLLLFFGTDDDPAGDTSRTYDVAGWTQLHFTASTIGNSRLRTGLWARVATGAEGNSVPVTGQGGTESTAVVLRVTDWHAAGGIAGSVAVSDLRQGFSNAPQAAPLAFPWGAGVPTLLTVASQAAAPWFEASIPVGYGGRINAISNQNPEGGGNEYNSAHMLGFKESIVTPETPGAFTLRSNFAWTSRLVAIRGRS